ncbi:MAG: hypothetical protein ACRD3O_10505 [Terriglobia bacterium]
MASCRTKDRYNKNDPAKLVAPAKARPYYYAEQTVMSRLVGTPAKHEKVSDSQPSPRGEGGERSEPGEGFRPNFLGQTVTKAVVSLGITKQPARTAKPAASSRETETAPSR